MKYNFFNKILKKTFLKESIIYGLSSALSKFSAFFTIPIYTRYLTVEEYGVLDLYLLIFMVLYILSEMQLQTGFMRNYYEKQKENTLDLLLGSVLQYYVIVFSCLLIIILGLNYVNMESKYLIYEYLIPIVLMILPKQIFDINNIVMRMEHKAKTFLLYNVSYVFTIALLGIILVVFYESSVEVILWSMVIGNMIFGVIALRSLTQNIPLNFNSIYLKEIFYYGAPIVPAVIGSWAMSGVGRVVIAENLTLEDLGIYSLALKVGMIFLIFVEAFRLSWTPFVVKKYGEADAKIVFAKALNYYMIIGLIFLYGIYAISPFLVNILATDAYLESLEVIPVLLLAYFWQGAINIASVGNGWVKKTYLNSIGSLSGALLVLVVTIGFITILGSKAAALGQLWGSITSFLIIMYFAQKNIKIQYSNYTIIILLCISIILTLISL